MLDSLGAKSSSFLRSLGPAWRLLGLEQRVAATGSLLLIVSTFGPFTFVEAAEVVTALGVLLLLKRRTEGYEFHLPFGDGTAIAAAGAWCGLLILIRLFDRPLGQNLLALGCAAMVLGAGMRERAKRPMDDVPAEAPTQRIPRRDSPRREPARPEAPRRIPGEPTDVTRRIDPDATRRIDPDATRRIDPDPTRRIDPDATRRIPRDPGATEPLPPPSDSEPSS
jgi:hypothetical protein